MDQQHLVVRQFGTTAQNYLTSQVHAQGKDLERLGQLAARLAPARALDLGCGGGHAAYALAAGTPGEVVAYDLAQDMLGVVAAEAAARGLANLSTCQGPAERLPFGDDAFDLVVTRYSAHHWLDVRTAVGEMARVLKPGGTVVVIDVVAPETPLFDTVLQAVELLRDASHVRDYRLSEWRAMFEAAGLRMGGSDTWKLPMVFASWIARIRTPADRVAALHATMDALPAEVRQYFDFKDDRSFSIDSAWMQAQG